MYITTTHTYIYQNGWNQQQWTQLNLCANYHRGRVCAENLHIGHPTQSVPTPYDASSSYPFATQQRNPTPQCIRAPPPTTSDLCRSGDKSDRGYTNNSSVSDQTVLGDKRRGHSPGPRRQELIVQVDGLSGSYRTKCIYPVSKTAPPVIDDERTRPPEQRRVRFEEDNKHRHLTNHSRGSNRASDSRRLDNRERRAPRPVEKRQQEADSRLRTHIAESSARTASRPVVQHRGVESMNPCSQKYHTRESDQEAQQERLRKRFQPKHPSTPQRPERVARQNRDIPF